MALKHEPSSSYGSPGPKLDALLTSPPSHETLPLSSLHHETPPHSSLPSSSNSFNVYSRLSLSQDSIAQTSTNSCSNIEMDDFIKREILPYHLETSMKNADRDPFTKPQLHRSSSYDELNRGYPVESTLQSYFGQDYKRQSEKYFKDEKHLSEESLTCFFQKKLKTSGSHEKISTPMSTFEKPLMKSADSGRNHPDIVNNAADLSPVLGGISAKQNISLFHNNQPQFPQSDTRFNRDSSFPAQSLFPEHSSVSDQNSSKSSVHKLNQKNFSDSAPYQPRYSFNPQIPLAQPSHASKSKYGPISPSPERFHPEQNHLQRFQRLASETPLHPKTLGFEPLRIATETSDHSAPQQSPVPHPSYHFDNRLRQPFQSPMRTDTNCQPSPIQQNSYCQSSPSPNRHEMNQPPHSPSPLQTYRQPPQSPNQWSSYRYPPQSPNHCDVYHQTAEKQMTYDGYYPPAQSPSPCDLTTRPLNRSTVLPPPASPRPPVYTDQSSQQLIPMANQVTTMSNQVTTMSNQVINNK